MSLSIDMRRANRSPSHLSADLVRLKVDVIVTSGPAATRAAKEATSTIPIVMTFDYDPVGSALSPALRDPAETSQDCQPVFPELSGKRLELLKEVVPMLSHMAVLGTSTNPGNAQALKEIELAAGAFKVKLQTLEFTPQGY